MKPTASLLTAAILSSLTPALADPPAAPKEKKQQAPSEPEEVLENEGELPDLETIPGLPRRTERPSTAPIRLSLVGWRRDLTPSSRDLGFGALLSFPLDSLSRPHALPTSSSTPLLEGRAGEAQAESPGRPGEESLASAELPKARVRALLRAAWSAAGLSPDEIRLSSLSSRARSSALLPELRLRMARTFNESVKLDPTQTDPLRSQSNGGGTALYEARVTWRLDRLLFADDEVVLERLRSDRSEQRLRLTMHLLEAITAWQRARLRATDTSLPPDERAEAAVREVIASTTLDALTYGAWSERAGSGPAAAPPKDPLAAPPAWPGPPLRPARGARRASP